MSQRTEQLGQGRTEQKIRPRGNGVFPRELVPIARAGDLIRLKPENEARRVETVVSVPTVRAFDSSKSDGVSVSGNSTSSDNNAEALEQSENWLGQFRLIHPEADLPANVDVEVDLGGAQAPLWTSKNARGVINADTAQIAGLTGALDVHVWQTDEPKVTFINNSGNQQTIQDLRFAGFQYQLSADPVQVPTNVQPVVVPTEAIASVSR